MRTGALVALLLALAAAHAPSAQAARAPDLQVASVTNPAKPSTTGTLAVRVAVRNGGNRKAPAFTLAVFLSADRKLDRRDVLLNRRSTKGLRPAGKSTAARSVSVPAVVAPGRYYLLACVDDRGKVRERNEHNNCRASATRVTLAGAVVLPTPATAPAPLPSPPLPDPTATATAAPTATATATATASPGPTATPPPGGPSDPPAPNPSTQAPPVSQAAVTSLAGATSFLYTGADPIQKDVEPGTIEATRVAVLRGRVRNRMAGPVAGVRVTVLDHPELGRTATRADGGFDLAVNGGGPLVLRFERNGYVSVQREVDAPWTDYATVDNVVMIPFDDQVTTVDLNSQEEIQVARANPVTDATAPAARRCSSAPARTPRWSCPTAAPPHSRPCTYGRRNTRSARPVPTRCRARCPAHRRTRTRSN